ncbi:MAG: NAD(P)/FAD-dependent oxidoreductase [Xanthobacteraceae bacterium]|nr:MAG: NAD(P)/FAD-dependent oxidoreductase [Xanthobacteraceae bacterium]
MSEPLVVIGNGMVAARLVEELSRHALGRYAIAVVGDEPRLAYNRVLLSSVLAGEVTSQEIELKTAAWWREHGVTVRYGCRAAAIDAGRRRVILADGSLLPFSKLVFATGSRSLRPNLPGIELPGVLTFRDAADAAMISAASGPGARAVVIGGGLLGIEAAYGLAKGGARVTLIHLMDRLMERQLDAPAAALLQNKLAALGVDIQLVAETARIDGQNRAEAVMLKDGRRIAADLVVVAIGIRPNTELAQGAGIACRRGIVVDDGLETSMSGIYAIGECAEHRGVCYGLVEPGYEQARVLARRLAGSDVAYAGSVVCTNLKVSGVNVFSAGDFLGEAHGSEALTLTDRANGVYRKLVVAGGRLTGAVLIGDTLDAPWYFRLIQASADIADRRDDLMFGQAIAERKAA